MIKIKSRFKAALAIGLLPIAVFVMSSVFLTPGNPAGAPTLKLNYRGDSLQNSKPLFYAGEKVTAMLNVDTPGNGVVQGLVSNVEEAVVRSANKPDVKIDAKVEDSGGQTVSLENLRVDWSGTKVNGDQSWKISFEKPANLKPGNYTTKIAYTDEQGHINYIRQDFLWGVLALNMHKNFYQPGEDVNFDMAVLDEKGAMVCDAKLTLDIKGPSNAKLSTIDESIRVNDACSKKEKTDKPDYEASWNIPDKFLNQDTGRYEVTLTAETANGKWQISDNFSVGKPRGALIERNTATRIYPTQPYEVDIYVTPQGNFEGSISETVPSGFDIGKMKLSEQDGPGWRTVRSAATSENKGSTIEINWNAKLEKGKKYRLSYEYDAPDESPQFYLLGPLTFTQDGKLKFAEPRQWQIAADDVLPTVRPNGDAADVTNVLNQANSQCTAVNCFDSIDDDPDSNNGDTDYNYSTASGVAASQQYSLGDTPANFVSMDSLNVKVAFRDIGTAIASGPDTHTLYAQIFASDGTTALSNEVIVHTHDGPDGSYTVTSAINFTLQGTNNKTTWDGARMRLRWNDVKDKSGDGLQIRVTAAELNGAYTPLVPQTTIATGTDPAAATVAPGSGIRQAGTFTLATNIGTDSVTALSVFLAGANSPYNGIDTVQIRDTNCTGTQYFSTITSPASSTLNFSGGTSIPASTTTRTLAICVTPKTHANMPAVPGGSYDLAPNVSSWTSTNGQAGSDTNPNTLTIDNLSPNGATSASGTIGNQKNTIAWTTSNSSDIDESLVLRWAASSPGSDVPVEGTDYSAGNTIGSATVACRRTGETASTAVNCTDASLTNGTQYSYKVFQQDSRGNYAAGTSLSNNPLTPTTPTYDQSTYRWFANNDSTNVGTALATQNTSAIAPTQGTPFRLRTTMHVNTVDMNQNQENFKLQFALKNGATCDINMGTTDESYSDVQTGSGAIRYQNNATPADGASLTTNVGDPTHGSDSNVAQSYEEANNFTNSAAAITAGQDGLWDFALVDNSASAGTGYCFRVVKSDGSTLASYNVVAEITTFTAATLTSIGSGTDPSSATVAPGSAIRDAGSFAFQTNSGTDTVTRVTVELDGGGTPYNGVAEVRITSSDGSTTYWGAVSNPTSNTITFCSSGCDGTGAGNIPVTTTSTQFKVRITPKTHANMPTPNGASYDLEPYVSSYLSTNSQSGSDNNANTLTIDNSSPGAASSLSGSAGNQNVTLNWTTTNGETTDSVVLRWAAAAPGSEVPTEGASYSAGNTISTATVACVFTSQASATALSGKVDGSGGSSGCNTTALTNAQNYSYKVFQKDANGNYDTGTAFPANPYTPAIPPITVSGNVYNDDSSVPLDACDDTTGLISVRIGSNQYGPVACDNSTGAFTVNNVTQPASGDKVVVWIDRLTSDGLGSTVSIYDGTGNMTGVVVRKDTLLMTHETGVGPVTNATAGVCDSTCDSNIVYSTPGGTGGGQITVADGVKLIVDTGKSYTPGGDVTTSPSSSASSRDGDVEIQSSATMTMSTNTLSVGGDLTLTGTYSASANQNTLFTATTSGHSITTNANNLVDATFNGSGGGWSFSATDTITETLTVTNGTLSGTNDLTVNHDVTGAGTINFTGGTFTQRVAASRGFGSSSGSNNWTFNNLTFSAGTAQQVTTNSGGAGTIVVTGNLNVGNASDTVNTTLNNETNDRSFDINGSLTITTRGVLSASSSAVFTIANNFTNSGTFTANSSTITFDSSNQSSVTGTGTTFFNLSATDAAKNLLFGTGQTFNVNGAFNVTAASINSTVNSPPYNSSDQWLINHQGTESVTVSNSVLNSGCAGGSTQVSVASGQDGGNNGTCWVFLSNDIPNDPTSLIQAKTDNTQLSPGAWNNSTNVKFSASVTDIDGDNVQLCVEVKDTGTSFTGTETCGTAVASGNTASVTVDVGAINGQDTYHWRARAKDNPSGATSNWVYYDTSDINTTDVGIDTIQPTTGSVYDTDGAAHTTDVAFNNGTLSTLSGGWNGFNDAKSGITKYEYSIGTTQGGTDVVGWTDNSLTTNKTQTGLSLKTSTLYYFNVRATDVAGNVSSVVSSDGQSVLPMMEFSVSPTNLTFSQNLNAATNNDTESTTLNTSTNAYAGYIVRAWATNLLGNSTGNANIPWISGTWASPASPGVGYGYTSSDPLVQGSNRFSNGTLFSRFNTSTPGDVIADHTSTVTGTPITDEQFTITHRIQVDATTQQAGVYNTGIVYMVTAEY